jgi:hypothetical protein
LVQKPVAHWAFEVQDWPSGRPTQVPPLQTGVLPPHSVLLQQLDVGTQVVVPAQFLKLVLQPMPQLVPSQVACPFDGGAGQAEQRVPQELGLVFDWQSPLQLCVPDEQVPLQALLFGMQAPLQS